MHQRRYNHYITRTDSRSGKSSMQSGRPMGSNLGNKRNSNWRRGGDSNPRYQFTRYGGLANRCFRPLSHLSKTIDSIDLKSLFGLRTKTAK